MKFTNWLKSRLFRSLKARRLNRNDRWKRVVEQLEDRAMLATLYVDSSPVFGGAGADEFTVNGGDHSNQAGLTLGSNLFITVQSAVSAAASGDTIKVSDETYIEDVTIGSSVSLLGSGAAWTTLSGAVGGGIATLQVAASNVTIGGFEITREGNTVATWNDPLLNSAGVAIQGLAITGTVIRDNRITGTRTGIDVNNSNGHTIRNNEIVDNRTGLIFRNQTDNLTVVENDISNNWTVGVLFLDASGGTNVPVQTALNSTFSNNNISDNWYGQIVDRQSGGALPAAGTTNPKNFSGNWLGTTSPVITTANSAEPGYAAQIPVAYGGSAVPSGGQPDIAGSASANFDITPLLGSGADTNVETTPGRGTFGFQGDFSGLTVTSQLAQTGVTSRIQEGVNRVTVGGNVNITAGTYNEIVTINKSITLDGAGKGGNPAVDTILTTSGNILTVAANDVTVKDLRVTGGSRGIQVVGTRMNLEILNSTLASNGVGFRMGTADNLDGLTITNSTFEGNTQGIFVAAATAGGSYLTNVQISDSDFVSNTQKGAYFEKLNNALFDGITVLNSGTDPAYAFNNGIDINLKFGAYSNITIQNSEFSGSGVRTVYGPGVLDFAAALAIKARNDAPSYNSVPATLTDVHVNGNVFKDSLQNSMTTAIRIGEPGKNNAGPTGVVICLNDLSDATFVGVDNTSSAAVDAEFNWWGTADGVVISAALALGNVDFTPWLFDSAFSGNNHVFTDGDASLVVNQATGQYMFDDGNGGIYSGTGATVKNGKIKIHDQSSNGKIDVMGSTDGSLSVSLNGKGKPRIFTLLAGCD